MGQFTLIKRDGTQIPLMSRDPFCAVRSAVQEVSLMGVDTVSLSIVSTQLISFQKGDMIIVDGDEYSIRTTVTRNRLSEDYYVYEPVFYGVMYDLMKTLYRNTDANGASASSVFDLTYTLKEFVRVIIYNLNRDYPGVWSFNELTCPDTEAMTVSFDKQNCLQVLQTLCGKDYFDFDFRITQGSGQRTIYIGHFGDVITPPGGADYFEWGKGNGLYELREEKIDDKAIKTRLWVEGGSQNISSSYRNYAGKLQLPYPQRLNKNPHTLKDGTVIAAQSETIGITDDACRYFEDAALAATIGSDEDAMEYEKIFPKRTGEVTSLCYDIVDGILTLDVNSFIDNTMDFNLTETDQSGNTKYLIEGVTAKITFVSGKLAGQQLELSAQDGYDHATKRFRLIPYTDERGLTIPTADNEAFRIAVGDKYKITDIVLPQSYIDDAEEELWYEGKQYFDTIKQARCRYTMILDRMYFIEETPSDQTMCVFKVGDYVPLKDTRFNLQKNIRITKVQRNLLLDQDYTVTLSDTHTIDIITQTIVDVAQHEVIIRTNNLKDLIKARRSWRTTQELLSMVFDVEGNYYSEKIKPLSIETSMLAVGAKSQQFVLTGVVFSANYNGNPNKFYASSGVLSHLTIDPTNIRNWNMATAEFTLTDNGGYFLYAKCPKSGNNAVWYLTQDQIVAEPTTDPSHWYFQVGLVGTLHQDDLFRDFATTYGFTRINGRTITTGRIESSGGGYTYFDLDEGEIGGNIKILSGSGYANLSDKPDLSVYTLYSEFSVTASAVSAHSTRLDTIENTISSAGWITTADGNLLWAAKSLESGNSIISYINQDATTVTINASKINLQGQVSFSMFNNTLQSTINGKQDSSGLGDLAFQSYVYWADLGSQLQSTINAKLTSGDMGDLAFQDTVSWSDLASGLQSTINAKLTSNDVGSCAYLNAISASDLTTALAATINAKLESGDMGAMAWKSNVAKTDLTTALSNLIDGKVSSSDLGSLAYYSKVGKALCDTTLISGGYILTSLIDVDSLYVKHFQASLGYVTITNDYSGLTFNYDNGTIDRDFLYVDSGGFKVRSRDGSDLFSVFSPTELSLNGGGGTVTLQNTSSGGYLNLQKGTQRLYASTYGSYGLLFRLGGLPTNSSKDNLAIGDVYRDGDYLKIKH